MEDAKSRLSKKASSLFRLGMTSSSFPLVEYLGAQARIIF